MNEMYLGKVGIYRILYVGALFLCLTPYIFLQVPTLYVLILKLCKPYLLLCIFLLIFEKMYKEPIVLIWLFIVVFMNLINWVNTGNLFSTTNVSYYITAIIMTSYMAINDSEFLLKCLNYFFTALLIINTLLWRPGGTFVDSYGQASFVIGTKTSITYYQIAACLFAYVFFKTEKNKNIGRIILEALLLNLVIYNFLQHISTSITCLCIFVMLIALDTFWPNISKLALRYLFWIITSINILIVIFRIQNYFEFLIVDVLGEDLTMSYRIYIWDEVISYIMQKPFFGYGKYSGITFINSYNTSCHNQLLGWAFCFGIIGFILMMALCVWIMTKYRIDDIRGRISRTIFVLFSFLWISEQMLSDNIFIIITVVLFYLNKYEMSDNENFLSRYFYRGSKIGNSR